MVYLPQNLPERLRKAGLTVVEVPGWETRGRPTSTGGFNPVGVLNHHTGSRDVLGDAADDLTYAKWLALTGRADLPAPLVQLSLSLEGTVYVLAAGRCNHAGTAKASGSVASGDGNSLYVGIEWMLSGTQEIPAEMMQAGATLNAVLLQILGSSVQAVSCHYQTSVTGKWDIGDPNGILFQGHRVLNVPKFRAKVGNALDALNPKPPTKTVDVNVMHCSLEYKDSDIQHTRDLEDIFKRARSRGVAWTTGTEAGDGAGNTQRELARLAKKYDYRVFVPGSGPGVAGQTDCWVAVARKSIKSNSWEQGYIPVIPGSDEMHVTNGRWGPKGIVWVSFENSDLGRVTVGAAHYLVRKVHQQQWNRNLAAAIGEWARAKGKGSAIVAFGADTNTNDRKDDPFYGSPLTSVADELEHWPNTGHGPIDTIATYDADRRVSAVRLNALDDKEFPQFHDHFIVEATLRVEMI